MVVGLEQTVYTVAESAGSVEVCAVVTNPPPSQPLSSSFTLLADTIASSAGKPSMVSLNQRVSIDQYQHSNVVATPFF